MNFLHDFLLFVISVDFIQSEKNGRLLLDDASLTLERLNRLESIVAHLNNTLIQQSYVIAQQTSELEHLRNDNQHLATENQLQTITIQQLSENIHKLTIDLQSFHETFKTEAHGVTYVRWASSHCSTNNTELVYAGTVGGGWYADPTSAPEPVCLPPDPEFGLTSGPDDARMYGAEFDEDFFVPNGNGVDLPCAVCKTKHASSVIMIPGRSNCYSGWNKEYHGYLSASPHQYAASGSFECVDINPEYVSGEKREDLNGKLFTPVLAKCGSLPCPPYKNDHPLTCVVCSK